MFLTEDYSHVKHDESARLVQDCLGNFRFDEPYNAPERCEAREAATSAYPGLVKGSDWPTAISGELPHLSAELVI